MKTALIAGASGLTGTELLTLLLKSDHYSKVYSLVRRKSGFSNDKLIEVLTDFSDLEKDLSSISTIDDVYCCLGTTMKKAGSKEAFRKVDHDIPVQLAAWAQKKKAGQFLCISAMGANEKSVVFYNKVKGETEKDISALNIPSVTFFRPSLLLGDRKESRPGEKAGIILFKLIKPLFSGPLLNYRGIEVTKVAKAIFDQAQKNERGVRVVLSGEMQ